MISRESFTFRDGFNLIDAKLSQTVEPGIQYWYPTHEEIRPYLIFTPLPVHGGIFSRLLHTKIIPINIISKESFTLWNDFDIINS